MEEIELFLQDAKESMGKAIAHTNGELAKIRAGKAIPSMLNGITVAYYGVPTPIDQVASISTPDARLLTVKPWSKDLIFELEKAIQTSGIGITPQNDGEVIRLPIPALTEERRKYLVKKVKQETEKGKISIRNIRKDTNESLKKLLKEGTSEDEVKEAEGRVQDLTDEFISKIDNLFKVKEKDIMTV